MSEINKYLHLYIGQKCKKAAKFNEEQELKWGEGIINYIDLSPYESHMIIKPLLIPIEKMTEEDALYCIAISDSPLGDKGFKIGNSGLISI